MNRAKWLLPVVICCLAVAAEGKHKYNLTGGIKGKLVGFSSNMIMVQLPQSAAGGAAREMKIPVNANTTVQIGKHGGTGSIGSLRAGEHVVVQTDENGVATTIQAHGHGQRQPGVLLPLFVPHAHVHVR